MSTRRYTNANPTAEAAIKAADKALGLTKDVALTRAAEAKRRGDLAGFERFMAAARRADRRE